MSVFDNDHAWSPYCRSPIREVTKLRWTILNPLQVYFPMTTFTIGEVIMVAITCAIFLSGGLGGSGGGGDRRKLEEGEEEEPDGSGDAPTMAFAMTFATAAHNSIFTFIFGLPFERALFWHRYFAVWAVMLSFLHAQSVGNEDEGNEALTGWIATYLGCAMLLALFEPLRRKAFELFYRFHWIIFIIICIALLAHGAGGVMWGVALWLIDIFVRYVWMAALKHGHEATIEALPADVIKITIPRKDFHYRAGQYCFICIPELSMFEWHPFSISTSPYNDDGYFTLHVRVLGDWTRSLKDLAQKKLKITILFEGPYGEPQLDLEGDKYKLFLLVSGGIGITPMQSICNQLLDEHVYGRPLELCYFVWSCREQEMVESVLPDEASMIEDNPLPPSFQPNLLKKLGQSSALRRKLRHSHRQQFFRPKLAPVVDETKQGILDDEDSCVHTEFYLTKAKNEQEIEGVDVRDSAKTVLRYGRPNIEEIFSSMKAIALEKNISRVAVLTCGPAGMVDSVQSQVRLQSGGGVQFDLQKETFAF